MLCKN
jgi:hypothetical protein